MGLVGPGSPSQRRGRSDCEPEIGAPSLVRLDSPMKKSTYFEIKFGFIHLNQRCRILACPDICPSPFALQFSCLFDLFNRPPILFLQYALISLRRARHLSSKAMSNTERIPPQDAAQRHRGRGLIPPEVIDIIVPPVKVGTWCGAFTVCEIDREL